MKKKLWHHGLLGLLLCTSLEGASWVGGKILTSLGLVYSEQDTRGFARYMAERDPVLGWPAPSRFAAEGMDARGARRSPAFPDPDVAPCISIYGDSYTWSVDVDDEHAWGNVLARLEGCKVANYGVSGYGTDQAYLRLLQNRDDRPEVLLLGVMSENILRNVNQLRNLLAPGTPYGLKPRFLVNDKGALELVPLGRPTEEEFKEMVASPERRLDHEFFLPGGGSGVSALRFPFTASMLGLFSNGRLRAAMAGQSFHSAFYRADHPAHGVQITSAILRAFRREAEARGALPGVIFLPLASDMRDHQRTGSWVYQPLIEEMKAAKIPYLNAGEELVRALGGRDPREIFSPKPRGHYSVTGYRLLGELVAEWLKKERALAGR